MSGKFKLVQKEDVEKLDGIVKSPEQYDDGKIRYIANGFFYYHIPIINGFITFEEGKDVLLEPSFTKKFYEKIIEPMRKK